jgi:5-methylcytosine-specific restriction endonuclease McrA
MTEREKFRIEEARKAIFIRDGYRCQNCGKSIFTYGTPQVAHCIAQTKPNIRRYGKDVIHHPLNTKAACSLGCNSAFNIGNNPEATRLLVQEIRTAIDAEKATSGKISALVRFQH